MFQMWRHVTDFVAPDTLKEYSAFTVSEIGKPLT
jgi:hypothetical protein